MLSGGVDRQAVSAWCRGLDERLRLSDEEVWTLCCVVLVGCGGDLCDGGGGGW